MKFLYAIWISISSVYAVTPAPERPSAISESRILKKYSLDQLAAARTLLRASLESENLCQLPVKTQAQYPQLLEALIRTKQEGPSTNSIPIAYVQECEMRCRCGFYAELYETTGHKHFENPQAANLDLARAITRAKKQDEKLKAGAVLTCAKHNLWLCESDLMKFLRSQTSDGAR